MNDLSKDIDVETTLRRHHDAIKANADLLRLQDIRHTNAREELRYTTTLLAAKVNVLEERLAAIKGKPMKTLEEHNSIMRTHYAKLKATTGNGIACPKCNKELVDSNDGMLCSMPPQQRVHCHACGFRGTRVC